MSIHKGASRGDPSSLRVPVELQEVAKVGDTAIILTLRVSNVSGLSRQELVGRYRNAS